MAGWTHKEDSWKYRKPPITSRSGFLSAVTSVIVVTTFLAIALAPVWIIVLLAILSMTQ